jgi:thiamine biosynthesis lipoprotein
MNKRLITAALVLVAIALLLANIFRGPAADGGALFAGETMGTTYSIRISDCSGSICEPLAVLIQDRLNELEQRLSHYDPASELSGFNDYSGTDWFSVSTDLQSVVEYALEISAASDGAFDITVAPAVNAWGFGPQHNAGSPDKKTINSSLAAIGYQKLATRTSPPALRKTSASLTLNLSALAKGYAVDQLALLLEQQGYRNYLVEIGGELRTAGLRVDGRAWRIGIEPPDGGLEIQFIVAPGDEALATSGDYRNFYFENGKRISHTIDPSKAEPVNNQLASVSVIAPSAMQADALATLFMVLGPEHAYQWAQEDNIPLLLLIREQETLQSRSSDAFNTYLIRK